MKEFIFSKDVGKLSKKDLFILSLFSYGRSTSSSKLQNDTTNSNEFINELSFYDYYFMVKTESRIFDLPVKCSMKQMHYEIPKNVIYLDV